MPGETFTEEARQMRREQDRQRTREAVEALRASVGWQNWLRLRHHFRDFSLTNQALIAISMPEATRVAGFRTWLKLGYTVRRGERARIRVWAKWALLHRVRGAFSALSVVLDGCWCSRGGARSSDSVAVCGVAGRLGCGFASGGTPSRLMQREFERRVGRTEDRVEDLDVALDRLFGEGVRPLRIEVAVFDAMLLGWARQQRSRNLRESTIRSGAALVRRVRDHAELGPWEWQAEDLEEFFSDLASAPKARRPATLRNYQSQLRGFLDFLVDERYAWRTVCDGCFGLRLVQLLDDRNLIVHVSDWESDPARRAMTRGELESFFDFCDRRVAGRRALRRKGSLAALRDCALYKVAYGFGLRRTELVRLDVCDLLANPKQRRFRGYGLVRVRYGKASRGSAPKRRDVFTVWPWVADVLEQYVDEIRPLFGFDDQPALWLTERGGRISGRHVDERFAEVRDEAGLDEAHTPHALRHSYITHLHEENFDPLFVKEQVGHQYMSTTALYTAVSSDYKQRALAAALDRQLAEMGAL